MVVTGDYSVNAGDTPAASVSTSTPFIGKDHSWRGHPGDRGRRSLGQSTCNGRAMRDESGKTGYRLSKAAPRVGERWAIIQQSSGQTRPGTL